MKNLHIRRVFQQLTLFTLCLMLTACASAISCRVADTAENNVTIYVVRHRWHTGLAVPADRLPADLDFLSRQLPGADYYEFGWGDDRFYQAPEDALRLAIPALFWPTDSVVQVVAMSGKPANYPHAQLQAVTIDAKGLERLGRGLVNSLQIPESGSIKPLAPGLYGHSYFYPARGQFWFGRNCNSWTVARLAQAGVDTGFLPKLTAGSVMRLSARVGENCK